MTKQKRNATPTTPEAKKPALIAWHVSDHEKPFWTRIGAAWLHNDGEGFTLQLDLVPVAQGRIVLRANAPEEEGAT